MYQFLLKHKSTLLLIKILLCSCCEGASITLSPLGMVSVCPGGQVLLTCERMSGFFLFWTVSIPRLAMSREVIVPSQGAISITDLQFNGLHLTEFNVTRTSDSPLISQLLINNVTTEINGSIIYCSEDGDENGAPAVAVNAVYNGRFLNVSLVNQLLGNNSVTVTLQWPRQPGAVHHINIKPETPHNEFVTNHHINTVVINLTISYNIQYNMSIISSLCGVTTTKVLILKYVTCDYPPTQLLHDPVVVVSGSQDSPPIEGQFITYTCPPGFNLTGPSTSVCMGNREWEPDPGQVDCIADHGCRVPLVNRYVKLSLNSTLEGSVLTLTCESEKLMSTTNATDQQVLKVICHSNTTSWIPDPTDFIESCSSFYLTTSIIAYTETSPRTPVVLIIMVLIIVTLIAVCVVSSIVFLSIGYACGLKCNHSRTSKASDSSVEENNPHRHNEGSQQLHPQTPGPLYEELQQRSTPEHQDLVELNDYVQFVAYGPTVK